MPGHDGAAKQGRALLSEMPATSAGMTVEKRRFQFGVAEARKTHSRHARPCAGHPRLRIVAKEARRDGRDKPGHDGTAKQGRTRLSEMPATSAGMTVEKRRFQFGVAQAGKTHGRHGRA